MDIGLVQDEPTSVDATNESQLFDPTPFYHLSTEQLRATLDRSISCSKPRNRGNYVRGYILSNLRIEAKAIRLRVAWNLEKLWDHLPVELIISIFEFLHPIDLYHAIRTTKGLRQFLLARNSTSIWKKSFLNHPDIPFYPIDVSAPKWASLIFGPATCDSCGEENSLVDYALRRRKCDQCIAIDYFYSDNEPMLHAVLPLLGEFLGAVEDFWKLPVKIYRFTPFRYTVESDYNFEAKHSLRDVILRAREMREYLVDIKNGISGAQDKYDLFMKTAEAAIVQRAKHAKTCELWAQDIYTRCQAAFIESIPAFCILTEKVLLKRGHDIKDIRVAQVGFDWTMTHVSFSDVSDPKFTKLKLRKYLPQIEMMVEESRVERLASELAQRTNIRKGKTSGFYASLKRKHFAPDMVPYLPELINIYELQFFKNYIEDPQEKVVDFPAPAAEKQIMRFVGSFLEMVKQRLFNILLKTGLLSEGATEFSNPDGFLGLAMALFECCTASPYIGLEEAGVHKCGPDGLKLICDNLDTEFLFSYSNDGYGALKNLADLLHFDPRSVSIKELDTLNRRFVCKTCKLYRQAGLHGLHAMTWRECIKHAVEARDALLDRHVAVFDILSRPLTKSIIATEQPFPSPVEYNWCCKCCGVLSVPGQRAEVVSHVKGVHGILHPVQGIDFVYCRSQASPKRSPLFVGLDEMSNHRCLRCSSAKSLRLWKKSPDMFRHLLDKHGAHPKYREGVDWIKIQAVEDENWIEEKIRDEVLPLL